MNMDNMKADHNKVGMWNIVPDMNMEKKKADNINSFQAGLSSIVFGSLCTTFYSPLYGLFFYTVGGLSIAFHFLDKKDNKYKTLFHNCGLHAGETYPEIKEKKQTNYGEVWRITLPPGMCTDDFNSKKDQIGEFIGCNVDFEYKNKNVFMKVFTNKLKNRYDFEVINTKGLLEFPVGYSHGDVFITLDLEKCPHLFISGTTGGGKSNMARIIMTHLNLTKSPKKIHMHLIDLKSGVEINTFRNAPLTKSFCTKVEDAKKLLKNLVKENDKRYEVYFANNVNNIRAWNSKFKDDTMEYHVVVIDEFADLSDDKEAMACIDYLTQKARGCGIHVIVSTQRNDSDTMKKGRIKNNISTVIGFSANKVSSQVIIGEAGLEKLSTEGRCLLKQKGKLKEIQTLLLEDEEAEKLIKEHMRKNKDYRKCHSLVDATVAKREKEVKPGEVDNFDFLNRGKKKK